MNDTHLLKIVHRTHYHYAEPVTFQMHRLVIRPREGHDLRVEQLDLAITPASDVMWTWDVFGNSIAYAHFRESGTELKIEVAAVVRRFFPVEAPPDRPRSPSSYPLDYDPLEQEILKGYVTPVFAEETDSVHAWIRSVANPAEFPSAEGFVVHLAETIHQRIRYERREQKGVQSPETTLSLGSGSCRDLATLMMETLRHLGIAARFASGYLDCAATRAAQGSTHAWTEVYFPQLGWRGFDPTTGKRCDHRHIVAGTSHHPRGVMPVTGKYFGPAGAFRSLRVAVEFTTLAST